MGEVVKSSAWHLAHSRCSGRDTVYPVVTIFLAGKASAVQGQGLASVGTAAAEGAGES